MTLLQQIKNSQLHARKERNIVRSSLLTTIIGEAEMVGKTAGNRESTDTEVIQILKKFEKNQIENTRIYAEKMRQVELDAAQIELGIIREFMPQKLSDDEVRSMISWIIGTQELKLEQKSLGIISKMLKEKYGDQFDGKQVSDIFKAML